METIRSGPAIHIPRFALSSQGRPSATNRSCSIVSRAGKSASYPALASVLNGRLLSRSNRKSLCSTSTRKDESRSFVIKSAHTTDADLSPNPSEEQKEDQLDVIFQPSNWQKAGPVQQGVAIGVTACLAATVLYTPLHPVYRLSVLAYGISTSTEWAIHKYYMHATDKVHMLHHAETNQDMTMPEGYNEDAVQFPLSATLTIYCTYVLLLCTLIFTLGLRIPYWYTLPCMGVVSFLHSGLWNTLHPDTHELTMQAGSNTSDSRSFGYMPWLPRKSAVWRWLIINHTGHHTIRGNYNCVFPGMDNIMGTFYYLRKPTSWQPSWNKRATDGH